MSAASHSLPYLPACQDVAGQLDLGEVSLADGLEQAVVADVRLLIWAGGDGVPASGAQWAAGLASGLVWAAGPQWYMLEEKGEGEVTHWQTGIGPPGLPELIKHRWSKWSGLVRFCLRGPVMNPAP